jgi:hypothetical protein
LVLVMAKPLALLARRRLLPAAWERAPHSDVDGRSAATSERERRGDGDGCSGDSGEMQVLGATPLSAQHGEQRGESTCARENRRAAGAQARSIQRRDGKRQVG